MAVAGREGTLRRRLRGTLGEGRFLGKTGTLDDVKAVAGWSSGPTSERYHLPSSPTTPAVPIARSSRC